MITVRVFHSRRCAGHWMYPGAGITRLRQGLKAKTGLVTRSCSSEINRVFWDNNRNYGSPRIWNQLRQSKAAVQVTVKRKTRYSKLTKLKRKGSREMSITLTCRLSRHSQALNRSITYDNGSENVEHVRTNRILGTRSYFCEPFHSWEKGTVENTIGLIRRFFPKKTDLATVSKNRIKSVEHWLNTRPRKCLGYDTPAEAFQTSSVALAG